MRFFSHSADKSKDTTLLKELSQAKQEMEDAYANFQNVSDPDLIDCYISEATLPGNAISFFFVWRGENIKNRGSFFNLPRFH